MRKLSSLFTGAALTLTVGAIGCNVEDADPFDSFNPTTSTTVNSDETGDGDGDATTGDGDGDGDPTTGDGDGDPTTGDGDGDPACGGFGEACCAGAVCDDTLTCDASNVCGLGGGDGDGDGDPTTGGDGNGNYDPAACAPPATLIGVTDVPGIFCSDPCTSDADCADVAPGQGACVLNTPPSMDPTNCALLCDPNADPAAACPTGATCQPIQGVGICTWPEP